MNCLQCLSNAPCTEASIGLCPYSHWIKFFSLSYFWLLAKAPATCCSYSIVFLRIVEDSYWYLYLNINIVPLIIINNCLLVSIDELLIMYSVGCSMCDIHYTNERVLQDSYIVDVCYILISYYRSFFALVTKAMHQMILGVLHRPILTSSSCWVMNVLMVITAGSSVFMKPGTCPMESFTGSIDVPLCSYADVALIRNVYYGVVKVRLTGRTSVLSPLSSRCVL